jgi:hypothetical protein
LEVAGRSIEPKRDTNYSMGSIKEKNELWERDTTLSWEAEGKTRETWDTENENVRIKELFVHEPPCRKVYLMCRAMDHGV